MNPFIRLTRIPYEEPYHLRLVIEASNGAQQARLELFINAESLAEWADQLEVFPKHAKDEFLEELGAEDPKDFAFYFKLRAFTTDSVGHCALHLRLNNNRQPPEREIAEFCIVAEPGQINRLGSLLREFGELKHTVLDWRVDQGELLKVPGEG